MQTIKQALIYDRSVHPERTNATFERLAEVLENVLGEQSARHISNLTELLNQPDSRKPLQARQADKIIDYLDKASLTRPQIEDMGRQLQLSEISTAEAIDIHRQYKIPVSHPEEDIIPVEGKGCWIRDTKGKWYLDMDSNYSATNLGMSNPEIALGLFNQASTLISMKEDRIQIARSRFLKEIHQMMPKGLDQFYWQNSGGEAVDKALKIAKAATGTTQVIAFEGGFHGRTHGAVAVTWNVNYRKPFGLDDTGWVHFAAFNDLNSVETLLKETGAKIILLEMVQGEEAGNRPAEQAFVDGLWKLAKKYDALIIDDEVQAGFGRTAVKQGDWFACMSYNVTPDIMVIGKTFGGGYPVTAVVTKKEVGGKMQYGYDGSTFGGNPMAMTAALIATRQMREKDITGNVVARAAQIEKGIAQLRQKHPVIGAYSGRGLMFGFDLGSAENVKKVQDALRENGVKVSLSSDSMLRFLPLTIITEGETNFFLEQLDKSLTSLEA